MKNMNVPAGYKQTELGVLPEDWEVKTLGELTSKIGSGITPTGGNKVYKSTGRPFVRSQNIGWSTMLLDDIAFIDEATHNTFTSTEIKKSDVLLNITGASIGRAAVAIDEVIGGNVNQHVCIIRPTNNHLESGYLCEVLLSEYGQNKIESFQAGGNRQGLNFQQIKSIAIPLPPLPEQQAIADALGEVDTLLSAQRARLAKQRAVKQGLLQTLLSGQQRLPGFAGEWEVKRLGDLFTFSTTANNSRSDLTEEGEIAYLHYGDIHTKFHLFLNVSHTRMPCLKPSKVQRSATLLKDGDLIIADASEDYEGIGKAVEIKNVGSNKVVAGLHTILLRPTSNSTAQGYRGYMLLYPETRQHIQNMATGVSVYGITKANLRTTPVYLPPPNEQRAIAALLSEADAALEALEAEHAKTQLLKQGLMQNLLTGKLRLPL